MKRLALLLTSLIACGPINEPADPGNPTTTGATGTKPTAKPATAGDVSIELDKIPINGLVFEPAALTLARPGVPIVDPKRKTTLAQQRSIVSNARDPVLKQAQAAVLATMLYKEAQKLAEQAREEQQKLAEQAKQQQMSPEKLRAEQQKIADRAKPPQQQLWTEARQALRDSAAAAGKDIDEVTLRMLGSYEIMLEDFAAAEKAWASLIAKNPKEADLPGYKPWEAKAWQAYSLLQLGRNAEALAIVNTEPLSDKQPELAYVTAWVKWRAGDGAAAWEALVAAARGWSQNVGKDAIELEALLMAARTKVPYAQAVPKLYEVYGARQPAQHYEVLAKLGTQAYQFAGRWSDAILAIEDALKAIGAQVPQNDRAYLRYMQADFTVRLDTPDVAARYARQAIDALGCPAKCSGKEQQDLISAVAIMARLFHIMYATANDIRYYQPANDLYVLTIPLFTDPKRRTDTNNDAQTLQRTLKNTKVGTGTHSKDAINVLIGRHAQEVAACYEERLLSNPKLGGTLTVTLDSDQSGAIKGVATEPKAGQADMAAVAGCVTEHARRWNLPKRGMAGTTRVKATFVLAPTAAAAPAAATPAAAPPAAAPKK